MKSFNEILKKINFHSFLLFILFYILVIGDIVLYSQQNDLNEFKDLQRILSENWIYYLLILFNILFFIYFVKFLNDLLLNNKKPEIRTLIKEFELKDNVINPTLFIRNFQGIYYLEFEIPLNTKWIFFTGKNGFGKTNILQAIARAFGNQSDNRNYNGIRPLKKETRIMLQMDKTTREIGLDKFIGFDKNFNFKVLGYGVGRLLMGSERSNKEYKTASGLFDSEVKLRNIEKEGLSRWHFDRKKDFNKTENILKQLIPGLQGIEVDDDYNVWYIEKDDEGKALTKVRFNELASGFQSIISMIGDLILNISSFDKEFKGRYKLLVLIDELELYLHPRLQNELPQMLSNIFPDVLFIATTHSPIPLLGAPQGSVFQKVTRTKEKGVQIERLRKMEKDIKFLLPNTILTSDIFDFDFFDDMKETDFKNLKLEDNYKDIQKNEEIEKRLKYLDKSIFPDNLFKEEEE